MITVAVTTMVAGCGGEPRQVPSGGPAGVSTPSQRAAIVAREDPQLSALIKCSHALEGVRAGSGLVERGSSLLVVQDDVPAAALVDRSGRILAHVPLIGDGSPLPKATKPDFEAAVAGPGGEIYVLGSGSAPPRRRIAKLARDGATVELSDAAPLHAALRKTLGGDASVEGAILVGRRLQLLHRGAGSTPSVLLEVDAAALDGAGPGETTARLFDLGTAAGIRLTFTDAAAHRARMFYLAVAEDTPNAIDDGPIRGAAVGVFDGADARYALLREPDGSSSVRKVEGLVADLHVSASIRRLLPLLRNKILVVVPRRLASAWRHDQSPDPLTGKVAGSPRFDASLHLTQRRSQQKSHHQRRRLNGLRRHALARLAFDQHLEEREHLVAECRELVLVHHAPHLREELVLLLVVRVMPDLLLEDGQLRVEVLVIDGELHHVREQPLHRQMLLGCLDQALARLLDHHRWIEDLLLDRRVSRELVSHLGKQRFLRGGIVCLLDLLDQRLDFFVLGAQ